MSKSTISRASGIAARIVLSSGRINGGIAVVNTLSFRVPAALMPFLLGVAHPVGLERSTFVKSAFRWLVDDKDNWTKGAKYRWLKSSGGEVCDDCREKPCL
jgi:hypothetical protein